MTLRHSAKLATSARQGEDGAIEFELMPNLPKLKVLDNLQRRFGEIRKLKGSESLFVIGNISYLISNYARQKYL